MKYPRARRAAGPAIALLLGLSVALWPMDVTFEIAVESDSVELQLGSASGPSWPLPDAVLHSGSTGGATPISGLLRIAPGVRARASRIGKGDVVLELSSGDSGARVGALERESLPDLPILSTDTIAIPGPWFHESGGHQVAFPFLGRLSLPEASLSSSSSEQALVHSGLVRMQGRTMLVDRLYQAGQYELRFGESVEFAESSDDGVGLVFIDQDARLQTVMRVVAKQCLIKRFGSQGFYLRVAPWERLRSDVIVQAAWSSAALVLAWFASGRKARSARASSSE